MREEELGKLLDVIIDHRGKTPKKLGGVGFTDAGVPVVSAIHIKNGRIDWNERRRYAPQWMFEKWMPVRLRTGDVLLTSEAPLGAVAQVEDDNDLILSQRLFALRGKEGCLDSTYLRYFLQSSPGQQRLLHRASGTTVFGIRQAELVRVKVPVPPIEEQRRIAGVLGTLDDLVDTNFTLAREAADLAAMLASRSPGRVPLSEIATVARVRQFWPAGEIDHFSIPAFDDRAIPERVEGSTIKSGKLRLDQPVVLVSRLNPNTPRIWMAYPTTVPAGASTEFVPLVAGSSVLIEEVWAACASEEFSTQLRARVTGTTGSHQRVDKAAIPILFVPDVRDLPPALRSPITALVAEAHASLLAAAEAAHVRDELLPSLLSGRIHVNAAVP